LIEFTDFVIAHPAARSETANRLRRYLERHIPADEADKLEERAGKVADQLEELRDQLDVINRQFLGLQSIEQACTDVFTADEISELQELFGLYAESAAGHLQPTPVEAAQRQIHWRQMCARSRDPLRRKIAGLAVYFYGHRLAHIHKGTKR
jgi:hypothetical protein